MRLFLVMITTLMLLPACASITLPDGSKVKAFGQSEAEYCRLDGVLKQVDKSVDKATDGEDVADKAADTQAEQKQKVGCLKVKGGALSGGVTDVLGDALKLPGALIRGAAAGLP